MNLLKNKIAKNFIIYLTSGGIAKAMPMIVLPLIANFLSPADFGLISNFQVLAQLFTAFISMRLMNSLAADYYNNNITERKSIVTSLIYIMLIMLLFLLVMTFFFKDKVLELFQLEYKWILLALFISLGQNLFDLRTTLLRLEDKSKQFAKYQVITSLITASLSIFFVIVLQWAWQGRVYATVFTSMIMIVLTLVYFLKNKWLIFKFDKIRVKEYLVLGLPLLPHSLTPFLRRAVDKVVITHYLGLAVNGVFSLASTLTSIFEMLLTSFFSSYTPMVYKSLSEFDSGVVDNKRKDSLVKQAYFAFLSLIALLSVGYFMLYGIVQYMFKDTYQEALLYLPWFMLDIIFKFLFQLFSTYVIYSKKTKFLGITAFSSGLLHALISLILVPLIGVKGALIAIVVTGFLRFLFTMILANKYYPMPWFSIRLGRS